MGVWTDLSLFRVDFDSNTRIFTMLGIDYWGNVYGRHGELLRGCCLLDAAITRSVQIAMVGTPGPSKQETIEAFIKA